ncbi:hypothetical protein CI088_01360 [Enterococcus plantarum]|uniref:XRE family transcriptional regulator n=1 Tax=Enterococcus plantarum TaxID=1077675 RepID=A0A2W3ZLN8_9ENTE|nr:hypothetical protein [Enterococcus plantarum]PZL77477.1 hypothetical protein CI088_01360 [Enterococcus plantarum]
MADIICIENLLKKYSLKEISDESEISYNTLKKMKYGERKITKFSLGDAIKLTTLWYRWEAAEEVEDESKKLTEESTWFDE